MASKQQLEQALINAHNAGDTDAARQLAAAIQSGQYDQEQLQPMQPAPAEIARQKVPLDRGRGLGGRLAERRRVERLEELRLAQPELAELIEEQTPMQAFLIGMGAGFRNVERGITGAEVSPVEKQAREALMTTVGEAQLGEVVGETAPFVLPASKAAQISTLAPRVGATGAIGATQGGITARGRGEEAGDIAKAATLTGGIAAAIELGVPYAGRLGGALIRRTTGRAPTKPPISESGAPSNELREALEAEGLSFEDFVNEAAKVADKPKSATRLREFSGEPDVDQEILAAAQRLGVDEALPTSALAKNQQFIEFEQGLTGIIGSDLSRAQTEAVKRVSQKADDFINEFGGSLDSAAVSDDIVTAIKGNIEDLRLESRGLYDQLSESVPAGTDVSPNAIAMLREEIERQADNVGGIDNLSPVYKRLQRLVGEDGKRVTYGLLDRERKLIGEQARGAKDTFATGASFELEAAERLLNEAQGEALGAINPDLRAVWSQAKDLVRQRKDIEKKAVQLAGKELKGDVIPKLGMTMKNLRKGQVEKFDSAISQIPKNLREQAVLSAMNDVFTIGARNQSQLNMSGFSSWYNQVKRQPQVAKRVLGNLSPDARKRLDDIAKVSEGFAKALAEKPQTGRIQSLLTQFDAPNGMVSKLYNVARAGGVDPSLGAVSAVVQAVGKGKNTTAKAADELLSSPEFKRMVLSYANAPAGQATRRMSQRLQRTKEFKNWIATLPEDIRSSVFSVGIAPYLLAETSNQ